jgi:hypothetical protein
MAAYKVKINNISTDGTSIYVNAEIFDGEHTFPSITPSFSVATTAAEIDSYFQTIANTAPTLSGSFGALVGKTYTQA